MVTLQEAKDLKLYNGIIAKGYIVDEYGELMTLEDYNAMQPDYEDIKEYMVVY